MIKSIIKFVFYPMLIVIVGMYYLISYLTVAIVTIASAVVMCKSHKKELVVNK